MNLWLIFWTLMLVVAGGSFAAITLVVTVRGVRDLRHWFASLSQQIKTTLAPTAVLPSIAEAVARTLRLPYVALALKQGNPDIIRSKARSKQEDAKEIAEAAQKALEENRKRNKP